MPSRLEIAASRPRTRVSTKSRPTKKRKARAKRDNLMPAPDRQSNKKSPFLNLPNELKLLVIGFVPVKDIPSLRLMSAAWAAAGAPALFRDGFIMRPYLDSMAQLKAFSQHQEIARGVRSILIYAGDFDRSQLEAAIVREEDQLNFASFGQPGLKIWKYVDAVFDESRFDDYCNPATLARCLPLLPNLEAIEITSWECPVPCTNNVKSPFKRAWEYMADPDDEEIQEQYSHHLKNLTSIKRYSSILSSIFGCKSVKKIAMDAFPIDMFRPRRLQTTPEERDVFTSISEQLSAFTPGPRLRKSLTDIKELRIFIIGAGYIRDYNASMGKTMADFIGCFSNITHLDISYEEDDEEEDNVDECCIEFERTLFRYRFPHLTSLRFGGTDSEPLELGRFLFKHRNTLRHLYIGECGVNLDNSTHKEILTYLRDHMKLTKFELFSEAQQRLYDANWKPAPYANPRRSLPDAKLLELYVTGKCPWPMAEENPEPEYGTWTPKFMGSSMELLDLGEQELSELFEDDWETDGESEMENEEEEFEDVSDSENSEDEVEDDLRVDEWHVTSVRRTLGELDPEKGEWEDVTEVDSSDGEL